MTRCTAEFVIEPFTDGHPGTHVQAGIEAIEAKGMSVSMGPFGSSVEGDIEDIAPAIEAMVQAAISDGADRVLVEITNRR
jgi:uncharacterized protein YqgV (UPF0045/DUF77 family)